MLAFGIEGQIEPRPHTHFEHAPFRLRHHARPVRRNASIAHRQIDQMRNDVLLVEAHAIRGRFT